MMMMANDDNNAKMIAMMNIFCRCHRCCSVAVLRGKQSTSPFSDTNASIIPSPSLLYSSSNYDVRKYTR